MQFRHRNELDCFLEQNNFELRYEDFYQENEFDVPDGFRAVGIFGKTEDTRFIPCGFVFQKDCDD